MVGGIISTIFSSTCRFKCHTGIRKRQKSFVFKGFCRFEFTLFRNKCAFVFYELFLISVFTIGTAACAAAKFLFALLGISVILSVGASVLP